MAKAEWGVKRICHNCGTRYYDLHRSPPVCPHCGTAYDPEAFLRSRRSRTAIVEEEKPARAARGSKAVVADDAVDDVAGAPDGDDEDEDLQEEAEGLDVEEETVELEDEDGDTAAGPGTDDLEVEEESEEALIEPGDDADTDADTLLEDTGELDDAELDEVPDTGDKTEER